MAAKHKTALSHVDLDKAFANIRNYSGARIDRKVFKIIAEKADDEGVARFTTHMSDLLYRVSGADDIFTSDGMSNSLYRLIRKGIIERASYSFDDFHYPHGTVTIAPDYMLHTATMPEPSDGTERIQELSGKLDNLADAIRAAASRTLSDAYVAKQTASKALDTATQAADLAQKNADLANENQEIVGREIERLTKQKERIDALEKHNTIVEALLAISILVGTVGIGGVVGCVMKILH